jgi:hypothetical protein
MCRIVWMAMRRELSVECLYFRTRHQLNHSDCLRVVTTFMPVAVAVALPVALPVLMSVMGIRRLFDQAAGKPGGHGFVGIGFRCRQGDDAFLLQAMLQPPSPDCQRSTD